MPEINIERMVYARQFFKKDNSRNQLFKKRYNHYIYSSQIPNQLGIIFKTVILIQMCIYPLE